MTHQRPVIRLHRRSQSEKSWGRLGMIAILWVRSRLTGGFLDPVLVRLPFLSSSVTGARTYNQVRIPFSRERTVSDGSLTDRAVARPYVQRECNLMILLWHVSLSRTLPRGRYRKPRSAVIDQTAPYAGSSHRTHHFLLRRYRGECS